MEADSVSLFLATLYGRRLITCPRIQDVTINKGGTAKRIEDYY